MTKTTAHTIGSLSLNTLLLTSKLISVAGLLWGFMYCAYGMYFSAVFPFSYTAIMAIVITLFHKGVCNEKQLVAIELFLILMLPALLQWSIGSFISSGGVVLWSLLGPIGSLLFQDLRRAIRWFGAFVFIIAILIIYELTFPQENTSNAKQILVFSAMNITTMSGILFYSLSYFVKQYIDKQEKINKLLEIESKARKELQTKTQNLESVLSEKEILLKEIHHRVKNNMQIIASLIALQVKNIESSTTIHEFQQIRNRINSMAIVHEMLYQSEDLSQIDYGDYVEKLALRLLASMKGDDSSVTYDFNVDHIKVNIDTAIPLGLLINELLTNALKYAFPNGQEGEVHLSIKQVSDAYELIIRDNGVGFTFDGDFDKLRTLGMRLVYSLVEQLEGTITQENSNGTNYFITFKNIDSSS